MIIPAIDLVNGQVVRLKQGDFNQKTVFALDPLQRIEEAYAGGARLMHIVDLDGAKDPARRQLETIAKLVKNSPLPIQTGGGIRTEDDVRKLLDIGVERVVIGSAAVKNPDFVLKLMQEYGPEHITLAPDVKIVDGTAYVATHGWLNLTDLSIDKVLSWFLPAGLRHVLVTDISKDGMMQGPNVELYRTLAKAYTDLDIIASGGISCLEDIAAVARAGAKSVVLGRALLEGKFTVQEAVTCWQNA